MLDRRECPRIVGTFHLKMQMINVADGLPFAWIASNKFSSKVFVELFSFVSLYSFRTFFSLNIPSLEAMKSGLEYKLLSRGSI